MQKNTIATVAITIVLAATLMLASAVVFIPQVYAPIKIDHKCSSNSPEGRDTLDPDNLHGCGPDHDKVSPAP